MIYHDQGSSHDSRLRRPQARDLLGPPVWVTTDPHRATAQGCLLHRYPTTSHHCKHRRLTLDIKVRSTPPVLLSHVSPTFYLSFDMFILFVYFRFATLRLNKYIRLMGYIKCDKIIRYVYEMKNMYDAYI